MGGTDGLVSQNNTDDTIVSIELHADDYGETIHTSEDILELMKQGHLDGVSILPNMHDFERTSRMLLDAVSELPFVPYLSVHLDLVEGRTLVDSSSHASGQAVTDSDTVRGCRQDAAYHESAGTSCRTALDSETGESCLREVLPWDWKKLFFVSLHLPVKDNTGRRMRYDDVYESLTREISLQIGRAWKLIKSVYERADECGIPCRSRGLRIDSHQHAHLIPVVWKALVRVIGKDDLKVEYIRTAHEPIGIFVKHFIRTWSPIGIVKNRILAILSPKVERYLMSLRIKPAYMWGLIMSGHMDMDRIERLMPGMLKKCARKGYNLEINIHPGRMLRDELTDEIPADSAGTFYLSENRDMEADTVRAFHDRVSAVRPAGISPGTLRDREDIMQPGNNGR